MTDDMTIELDGERYLVRRDTEGLQVGRTVDGETTWLDTVDESLLSGPALAALERSDGEDEALRTALRGIVEAETHRGG
jgi:hypothetical protein